MDGQTLYIDARTLLKNESKCTLLWLCRRRERTARDQTNEFILFYCNPFTMLYEVGVVFVIKARPYTRHMSLPEGREAIAFHTDGRTDGHTDGHTLKELHVIS